MRLKREAEQGTGRHGECATQCSAGRPVGSHLHAKLTEKALNPHDVIHSRRKLVQQIEGSRYIRCLCWSLSQQRQETG